MTEPTDEASETEPPARRRFVIARLAAAVKRQDWFTVLVEVAVVVLGVIIGFQVTDWGQHRSDRAKEQVYLRQLLVDLRETERAADEVDAQMDRFERAPLRLAQAYYLADLPPRDSLVAWGATFLNYRTLRPVLGTAEALVSTGDLALVRDDSLRIAISAYLDGTRGAMESVVAHDDWVRQLQHEFALAVNIAPIFAEAFSLHYPEMSTSAALDSLDRAAGGGRIPQALLVPPSGDVRPVDWDALLRDEQVHRLLNAVVVAKSGSRSYRNEIRQRSSELREQVEAELMP